MRRSAHIENQKDIASPKKRLKKELIGFRQFKFFYIIYWIIKYCIIHWTNPAVLSRLNPELPYGGTSTLPKSSIYEYFVKNNAVAKKYFVKCIKIPKDMSWREAKDELKQLEVSTRKKRIVLKPDKGLRSIGVMITSDEKEIKQLLETRGNIDYIAQEEITHKHELGVFYYKYPDWTKGKILGIADKKFERIVDPRNKEQYSDRPDLITPQVTEVFNKIVGNKAVYFCRFDIRTDNLEDFKKGRGFNILEANAGPEAVALHALDSKYPLKKQLKIYTEEYIHAFKIAELNKNRPKKNLISYLWFMTKNEIPLQILRFKIRKIVKRNHEAYDSSNA